MTSVPFGGRLLIVEPDPARAAHLRDTVRELADIDRDADFLTARAHLFSQSYDWLVTNVRIGAYNGLHLVHLVDISQLPVRALVYADRLDLCLAREAQQLGAFYESGDRIDRVLPAYLRSVLPPQDRRSLATSDRRTAFRGSRRCGDSSSAMAFASPGGSSSSRNSLRHMCDSAVRFDVTPLRLKIS